MVQIHHWPAIVSNIVSTVICMSRYTNIQINLSNSWKQICCTTPAIDTLFLLVPHTLMSHNPCFSRVFIPPIFLTNHNIHVVIECQCVRHWHLTRHVHKLIHAYYYASTATTCRMNNMLPWPRYVCDNVWQVEARCSKMLNVGQICNMSQLKVGNRGLFKYRFLM